MEICGKKGNKLVALYRINLYLYWLYSRWITVCCSRWKLLKLNTIYSSQVNCSYRARIFDPATAAFSCSEEESSAFHPPAVKHGIYTGSVGRKNVFANTVRLEYTVNSQTLLTVAWFIFNLEPTIVTVPIFYQEECLYQVQNLAHHTGKIWSKDKEDYQNLTVNELTILTFMYLKRQEHKYMSALSHMHT